MATIVTPFNKNKKNVVNKLEVDRVLLFAETELVCCKAVSEMATKATATARSPASAYSSTLVDALI